MTRLRSRFAAAFGVMMALGLLVSSPADARRGGSFGSRGMRTYSAPRSTATAPGYVAPVQRSMTPNTGFNNSSAYAPRPAASTAWPRGIVRLCITSPLAGSHSQ